VLSGLRCAAVNDMMRKIKEWTSKTTFRNVDGLVGLVKEIDEIHLAHGPAHNTGNYDARSLKPAAGVQSHLRPKLQFQGERAPLVLIK